VDCSVIHLAGTLARPAFVLLPYFHEWRWLRNWYPTVKAYRQQDVGGWEKLLVKIKSEVINYRLES